MTKPPRITAADLGIEIETRRFRKPVLVPEGGLKNVRDKTVHISLPRVRCLERPEAEVSPRDLRARRR